MLGHPWGFTGKGPSWPFDVFAKGPKNNNLITISNSKAKMHGLLECWAYTFDTPMQSPSACDLKEKRKPGTSLEVSMMELDYT